MTTARGSTRRSWPGNGLLALVLLALVLPGCLGGRTAFSRSSVSAQVTPSDPPPLPRFKPMAPSGYAVPAGASAAQAIPAAQATQVQQATPARIHVVQRGDTAYGVARRYGLRPRVLLAVNRIGPPYQLRVGQRLRIPAVQSQAVASASPATAAPNPAPAAPSISPQPAAAATPPLPASHEVAAGETVYGIAKRYRVDMAELARLNGIGSGYKIARGQKLILPGAGPGAGKIAAIDQAAPAVPKPAVPEPAVEGPLPKPPPRAADKFLWPLAGKTLTGYGPKKGGLHNDGINIAAPRGSPIRAAENGVVAYAGNELRGFGNLLLIKHADGWITAYAHTDKILVGRGQRVQRGQVVAQVGLSGNVAQPQLHFEIRKGTRAVNPEKLLGAQQSAKAY